ncbi:MAG: ectoine/hydroxyectoine ABC transporter permease subunit EhuC [Acidimicrobiia bacterium]|nr:ectoine/hydroxyectoine ABC transporter permease subunit EhuC [Acidimicrobiia bacterium]
MILTPENYERLWEGVQVTVTVFVLSVLLGAVLSLIFGVAKMSQHAWVRAIANVYVEFARGVSAIILLFWVFFSLPTLLGISLSPLTAGFLALGVNMGAYGAEVVRGGLQNVPRGQTEATVALNMKSSQRLRYVILPQAIPVILPPFGNLMIEILKGTALVSLITLSDLTFEVDKLRTTNVTEGPILFLHALIIYFILAQIISTAVGFFERRSARRFGLVS